MSMNLDTLDFQCLKGDSLIMMDWPLSTGCLIRFMDPGSVKFQVFGLTASFKLQKKNGCTCPYQLL